MIALKTLETVREISHHRVAIEAALFPWTLRGVVKRAPRTSDGGLMGNRLAIGRTPKLHRTKGHHRGHREEMKF